MAPRGRAARWSECARSAEHRSTRIRAIRTRGAQKARVQTGRMGVRDPATLLQQPPSTTAPVARLRMLTQPALPVTKLSNRLASLLTFEPGDRDLRCPSDARQNHLQKLSDLGDGCGDSFF